MALQNFEKTAGTLGTKLLRAGNELGRDMGVTLPEVTYQTIDMKTMGTRTFPIRYLLDDMEATITAEGVDMNTGELAEGGDFEYRFAQLAINRFGGDRLYGCKAFFHGTPKNIPGFENTVGENAENEFTYSVDRYRLLVDGKEMIHIDRNNNIIKINGKDYAQELEQYL